MSQTVRITTATAGLSNRIADGESYGQPQMNFARCSIAVPEETAERLLECISKARLKTFSAGGGVPEGAEMAKHPALCHVLQEVMAELHRHFFVHVEDKRLAMSHLLYDHLYGAHTERAPLLASHFRAFAVLSLLKQMRRRDGIRLALLEDLIEHCERYCREVDLEDRQSLIFPYGECQSVANFELSWLARGLRGRFGPEDPAPFPGQPGLSERLLVSSLEMHIAAWRPAAATLDLLCEATEPMRKLEWNARTDGGLRARLASADVLTCGLDVHDRSMGVALAAFIAEFALATCGLDWQSNGKAPRRTELTRLQAVMADNWTGEPQLGEDDVDYRLIELERLNIPLIRTLSEGLKGEGDPINGLYRYVARPEWRSWTERIGTVMSGMPAQYMAPAFHGGAELC